MTPVGLVSNISVLPSVYLTSTLARPQEQEENCLEGQMLFNWFKMNLCQLVQKPGRGSRGGIPSGLWVCLSETIQETSEIFILTDIDRRISQFISNG